MSDTVEELLYLIVYSISFTFCVFPMLYMVLKVSFLYVFTPLIMILAFIIWCLISVHSSIHPLFIFIMWVVAYFIVTAIISCIYFINNGGTIKQVAILFSVGFIVSTVVMVFINRVWKIFQFFWRIGVGEVEFDWRSIGVRPQ